MAPWSRAGTVGRVVVGLQAGLGVILAGGGAIEGLSPGCTELCAGFAWTGAIFGLGIAAILLPLVVLWRRRWARVTVAVLEVGAIAVGVASVVADFSSGSGWSNLRDSGMALSLLLFGPCALAAFGAIAADLAGRSTPHASGGSRHRL